MSVPRGFFEADGGFACDSTSYAFVRGVLLPQAEHDKLSFEQRFALQDPNVFPRWRLYGGPFSLRQTAEEWDHYLKFWAFQNGAVWVSHGTFCLAPPTQVPWPADKSLQWTWVNETSKPARVRRVWDSSISNYRVVWE
jgi:hypothetical protein